MVARWRESSLSWTAASVCEIETHPEGTGEKATKKEM